MAENESIGGVSISIVGDFSSLQSDFAQAQAAAKDAGDKIAAAMTSGMMATADFDAELKKLVDDGKSINEAMVIMAARFTDAGTAAKQAGGGVLDLDGSIKELASDTKQLAPAVTQVNTAFSQMGSQLMTLGAYYLSARFLKTLATDALESYGALQNATIALTYLTGSAATADGVLAGLRDLAISDALSFPSLVTAEQRMLEFGVSAGTLPTLLGSIADAAAITNRSFDAVANSMERMIESGMVQARSLVQVGLSLEDLGKVMGIASEEVKAAFADLDPTQRAQVFADAMAKMSGVAKESAQTITGQWRSLQAVWEATLQQIGGLLAPFATEVLNWARDITWALGQVASAMSAVGSFALANFNASIGKGIGGSGEVVNQNNQSLQGTGALAGRPGDFGGESNLPTSTQNIDSDTKAIVAHNQAVRDAAQAALDAEAAMKAAWGSLGLTDTASKLSDIQDSFNILFNSGQLAGPQLLTAVDSFEKSLVAAFHAGSISAADFNTQMDNLEQLLQDSAAADDNLGLTFKQFQIPDTLKQLLGPAGTAALTDKLGITLGVQTSWFAFDKLLNEAHINAAGLSGDLAQAQEAGIAAAASMDQIGVSWKIAVAGIAAVSKASLAEATETIAAHDALLKQMHITQQASTDTIIADNAKIQASNEFTDQQKLKSAVTTAKAIQAESTATLQVQIDLNALTGKDSTAQIIQLDGVLRAQTALRDQSELLGKTYVGLMGDFQGAFGALGKGIADNIVDGKNWGDVFMGIIDNLAKAILNTLIGSAFKQLGDELLRQGGLLSNFSKGLVDVIGKLGVGGGSAAATAAGAYNYGGETVTSGAAEATSAATTAGGSSSSGIGGLLGGGGLLGLAGLGVQIASGIVNGLQNARLINLTGEIEVSTRAAKEQLIANELTMDQYLPELGHLVDIWSTLETIQALINQWMHNPGNAAYAPFQQSVDTPVTSRDPNSLQTNYLRPGGRTAGGLLPSTQFPTSLNALSSGWAPELLQPLGDVNANNPLAPGKGGPGSLPPSWTAPIAPGNPLVAAYPSDPGGAVMSQLAVMLARQAQMPTATLPSYPENPGAMFLPNTSPKSGSLGAYDVTGGRAAVTVNALNPSARSVAQAIIQALNERGMRTT